ncbi:MAG: hypothetical protein BWK76_15880 [Desulfobulbaceae bacterium A2]|nr:MAG: hypothetical protein BWK76_15880 [Desulfobulbaceae bacterium A2]
MQEQIIASLEPFDILLRNRPYSLTNWFIPGFFTHASIYLGDLTQLQEQTPEFPWQEMFNSEGEIIIESTRQGVAFNPVKQFLNCDSLLVLRDPSLTPLQKKNIASNAIQEIGKKYEYGFNLTTPKKQFCAKLVVDLFQHIPFLDNLRDSPTILPDHIGSMALMSNGNKLQVIKFCINGICLPQEKITSTLHEKLSSIFAQPFR